MEGKQANPQGLLNVIEIKGNLKKGKNISINLRPQILKELDNMAKEIKVSRSFLVNEFLQAAITLEKGMGLENYAKANLVVNGLKPFTANSKQATAKRIKK